MKKFYWNTETQRLEPLGAQEWSMVQLPPQRLTVKLAIEALNRLELERRIILKEK